MHVLYLRCMSYAHDIIVPDKQSELSKKKQVAEMFDSIAGRYDFLNRFLSIGIDVSWRKKAIQELKQINAKIILDVATGTGDVTILANKILKPQKIVGIDISEGMLELGRKKIDKLKLSNTIELQKGDSEKIYFNDNFFDAETVAFGVRNFENLELGLSEMLRVLKPGGKVSILEFSKPKTHLFKGAYTLYMKKIAPAFGKMFAKNKDAYSYLNNSVQAFPDRENFIGVMKKVGYKQTYFKPLTLGICCVYCGSK